MKSFLKNPADINVTKNMNESLAGQANHRFGKCVAFHQLPYVQREVVTKPRAFNTRNYNRKYSKSSLSHSYNISGSQDYSFSNATSTAIRFLDKPSGSVERQGA